MLNSLILPILVIWLVSLTAATLDFQIKAVHNIEEFKSENPDVKLEKMYAYDHLDQSRSYSLGNRQTGDVVVANGSDKKKYPELYNVSTTLSYPSTGVNGAYLTYILINCEQSSNNGVAYVTRGGVRQHFVQIVIETPYTNFFNYAAFFYGVPNYEIRKNKIEKDLFEDSIESEETFPYYDILKNTLGKTSSEIADSSEEQ